VRQGGGKNRTSSSIGIDTRLVRDRYEMGTGLIRDWYEIGTRSVRDWCEMGTRLVRDRYEMGTGLIRDRYEIDTRSVRDWCEIGTRLVRDVHEIVDWHGIGTRSVRDRYEIGTRLVRDRYEIGTRSIRDLHENLQKHSKIKQNNVFDRFGHFSYRSRTNLVPISYQSRINLLPISCCLVLFSLHGKHHYFLLSFFRRCWFGVLFFRYCSSLSPSLPHSVLLILLRIILFILLLSFLPPWRFLVIICSRLRRSDFRYTTRRVEAISDYHCFRPSGGAIVCAQRVVQRDVVQTESVQTYKHGPGIQGAERQEQEGQGPDRQGPDGHGPKTQGVESSYFLLHQCHLTAKEDRTRQTGMPRQ